ncbi:hypothetical protein LZP69_04955 [Shewanella sp. AS1]|uniref:VC2046/SO_2500 family protein n=1 Tax=Shewanella sp. AS1 TaxID=2907626 RepID=UPI001F34186B|nr:VC2046/SO_2500 family protein [Shewanella sp. AS1]MCE9678542.1 hypothetical protein [Shewanella sp. AS1]
MQSNQLLINEVNLGTRLNQAVGMARRGEFALLLAMLSNDVCDMAQFHLQECDNKLQALRQKFQLPPPQPYVADLSLNAVVDNSACFHHSLEEQSHTSNLTGFHLQHYLTPEALVVRGRDSLDMHQVLTNCDPVTQARHKGEVNAATYFDQDQHFSEQLVAQRTMAKAICV